MCTSGIVGLPLLQPAEEGRPGAWRVTRPLQRGARVHVTEGSSAKQALKPPLRRGGGR
jgi:hypothetical protein